MENELSTDAPAESSNLQAQVDLLRQQMWTLLVLMVVISGTFSIYLMAQMKTTGKDLSESKQLINQAPAVNQFIQHLGEYGRTHPDFVPILNKYGIIMVQNPAGMPSTQPAPTAPKK